MEKTVDFFNWKKKHRSKYIGVKKSEFRKYIIIVFFMINLVNISAYILKNRSIQNFMLHIGSNILPVAENSYTVKDISKIFPVLNANNYVMANVNEIEQKKETAEEIQPENNKFDGSAVSTFSYSKNDEANIKISYTSNYQKVKMYGFTITNYAGKTDIDYEGIYNKETNLYRIKDKILLYCTHTSETYVNSEGYSFGYTGTMRCKDPKYNMLSVASVLQDTLKDKNFNVILDTTPHDYTSYDNAYTNSRQTITNQIKNNGKFGLMIDVHRDAYGSLYTGPTVEINGKEVALIMVVVGIGTDGYANPYWETNLSIAMKIMKIGEEMYPGLFRPLLIRDSRYNQDLNKGAILTEVGTTGNTHEQIYYAATCLGNILDKVFK